MNRVDVLQTIQQRYPGWEVVSLEERIRERFRRGYKERCKCGPVRMFKLEESQEFTLGLRHQIDWNRTLSVSLTVTGDNLEVSREVLGIDGFERNCKDNLSPQELLMESMGYDV